MFRKEYIVDLSILLTLGLFGVASFYPLESMWGINHLHFLPDIFSYLYWIVVTVVIYLMVGPIPEKLFDRAINKIDSWLWGNRIWPRLVFVAGCTALPYLFRVETHLLGDGYTWLAVFGKGESYIHKWVEPGSILLLRQIQSLLGGYTRDTALLTFQILSILSGAIFVYNILSVIGRLCSTLYTRVLGLSSVLLSGGILLFFGYVEFYSISWAICTLFINLSLRSLQKARLLWPAVALYLLAALSHLQAIYFLPGIVYLIIHSIKLPGLRKIGYTFFGIGAVTGTALIIWLYQTKVEFEILILPLFEGRPIAPDFTVFSKPHLSELANLLLLVFPGSFVLFNLWFLRSKKSLRDPVAAFLAFLSFGSLLFLCLFGAAITMGRDWDIMSLSLLPPVLLILYQIDQRKIGRPERVIINYLLMVSFVTISFLAVSVNTTPTEDRFHTLLNNRSRNGWVIYANYFLLMGDTSRYRDIMLEMSERYPNYALLQRAYEYLERGNYSKTMQIAEDLVNKDPYQSDFLQLLATVHGKYGRFDRAEKYYHKALKLHPYQPTLMNELGQLYIEQRKYDQATAILKKAHWLSPERTFITESLALAYIYQQHYDSALLLADTLFMDNMNSPGRHLIEMTVALNKGNKSVARQHLIEYLKYGSERSDYQNISAYYHFLLEESR